MDIATENFPADPGRREARPEPKPINPELFARNMDVFRRVAPHFHAQLVKIEQPQSALIANPDGGYDIEFGGTRLYGGNHRKIARDHVKKYFQTPEEFVRFQLSPPASRSLDEHANRCVYRFMKRAVDGHGIVFSKNRMRQDAYHLVVLGVGLGAHIPPLVRRTKCRHLLIVEPNLEFFLHSLRVFNWADFLQANIRDGRLVHFVTDPVPGDAAQNIRGLVRSQNAPALDGMYVYRAFPSSFMHAVASDLSKSRDQLLVGLGFLDDECWMVKHTQRNLAKFSGRFMYRRDVRLPVTAFVVAAGPSVDDDLDFIRANADRAIVISCGTGLRILLSNGIRPDFHMEMENGTAVFDLISKWGEKHSLRGITLVATTTIDPRLSTLFDQTIFYIRPGLASAPMFSTGPDGMLAFAGPMVANLGLAFAQHAGASTICLFGVDCGTRDQSRHHGKDAPYMAGEMEFNYAIDRPTPGNFGGIVFSEFVYLWCRDELQRAIRSLSPRVVHYNCSDGARIEGATPKLSRTLNLPACDKNAVVAKIVEDHPPYPRETYDAAWTGRNHVRAALEFRKKLLDGMEDAPGTAGKPQPSANRNNPLRFLDRVVRNLLPPTDEENSPEYHYFRGTIYMAAIAMYFYYGRVINSRKRAVFTRIIREELVAMLDDMVDYIIKFYRELDPEKTKRDEKKVAKLRKEWAASLKISARPLPTKPSSSPTSSPAARKTKRRRTKTPKSRRGPKRSPAARFRKKRRN